MYHRKAKQVWAIGARVNVGFLRDLLIVAKIPTPGDYQPDQWELVADSGARYLFTPHLGIERIN